MDANTVLGHRTGPVYGFNHPYDVRRRWLVADLIEDIIGDYRAFAAQQRDRLATRGIDITSYGLSHLAYRVPEWDQYVHQRVYKMGLEHLGVVVGDTFDGGRRARSTP